jgi:hypothetical protein
VISAAIAAALDAGNRGKLPGRINDDELCQGAKFHSPTPLVVHAVTVSGREWLCATCRDNLAVFRHLLAEAGGSLPWPVARCFGNRLRALAEWS